MKRIVFVLLGIFLFPNCYANTETITWYVDDNVYTTTTCESGGDIVLPTAPTKRGYTFMGWEGFATIEYLESTGTQWIDTGIKQSDYAQNIVVTATFQCANNSAGFIVGVTDRSNGYFFPLLIRNGYFQSNVGSGGTEIQIGVADTNKHNIVSDTISGTVTIDDTVYNYRSNTAKVPYDIYFFAVNRPTESGASDFANAKIYNISFQTGDGTFIRDFIPVLDHKGVPCMYDKVSKTFFYNSGTGDFIAGPVISGE